MPPIGGGIWEMIQLLQIEVNGVPLLLKKRTRGQITTVLYLSQSLGVVSKLAAMERTLPAALIPLSQGDLNLVFCHG
jgi:hypothetical protein